MKNLNASFDVTTKDGKIKAFNAQQASVSLKSVAGQQIEVEAVLQHDTMTEEYGAPQEVRVTSLFGTDGIVYSSISSSVADAGKQLIDLIGEIGVMTIQVNKQKSKKDQDFLSISIV